MTPKPKFQKLNVHVDNANRRVFLSWIDAVSSGTLHLTAEQAAAIGQSGEQLRALQAELDCARCQRPFDPNDKTFVGRRRHADTPFCEYCVSQCHEAGADHRCQICTPTGA